MLIIKIRKVPIVYCLSSFTTEQDPLFTCSNTLTCVNADRYIAVYCLISLQYRSNPFYHQNTDRYICRVLSYLFSIQIKNNFTNRMVTGIFAEFCLTSFQIQIKNHFTNRMVTGILQSMYCLTTFQYRSNPFYLQNGDRYIVVKCFISLLLQIKRHIFNLFTSLISPTD